MKKRRMNQAAVPDNTAVRTALWRAFHTQEDAEPHIIEDEIGLKLAAPPGDWKERPDMKFTRRIRASIVARSRYIEDLILEKSRQGIRQYVILGAGLDSFAQRRQDAAASLQVFEIDRPETQSWKKQRLTELGLGVPPNLHFVPVDFESGSWWDALSAAGFDTRGPAVLVCTGVILYLTEKAIMDMLETFKRLAPGSVAAVTYNLPPESVAAEDRPLIERSVSGARASGTPMISFFNPEEILDLARRAGFKKAKTVSVKEDLEPLYFKNRTDGFSPAAGEGFLMITV